MNKPSDNISRFTIKGMHCGACVKKVQAALAPFADNVEVSLIPPQASLSNNTAATGELNQALREVGDYQLIILAGASPKITHETTHAEDGQKSWFATYKPLLLIIGYILIIASAIQLSAGHFDYRHWMMHFMAGFFLTFSFFKFLDLRGFASSYAMYDLLAMRVPVYGYIYPFIELGLGLAYVLNWQPHTTNLVTFIVMLFSSLGVIRAVLDKQKIRCACLGSVFNLPMSTITIIEDLLMATMAGWMLF